MSTTQGHRSTFEVANDNPRRDRLHSRTAEPAMTATEAESLSDEALKALRTLTGWVLRLACEPGNVAVREDAAATLRTLDAEWFDRAQRASDELEAQYAERQQTTLPFHPAASGAHAFAAGVPGRLVTVEG